MLDARTRGRLLTIVLLVTPSGCASYQVRTPSSDPADSAYVEITAHNFFWGLVKDPEVISAEDQAGSRGQDGINDVIVKDNLLFDFISVVTLGIWKPITIEYRLRAPQGAPGGHDDTFPTEQEMDESPADPAGS